MGNQPPLPLLKQTLTPAHDHMPSNSHLSSLSLRKISSHTDSLAEFSRQSLEVYLPMIAIVVVVLAGPGEIGHLPKAHVHGGYLATAQLILTFPNASPRQVL